MSVPANLTPLRPKRKCPECGRPSTREAYPFCSAHCKAVDLNRWLSGSYVIPGAAVEVEESAPSDTGEED
ncbi:DNA gyrase inhibitor YacG [Aurantimonas sp. VKM B-3413]|uniref:DNA gyrase inhibitor YacG n=1 Tax=Aurantimonas sp. VKM B-3413 TaxID=2779401 RepID=UPI001E3192E8|nr:DNA gyrase inhibitor YacG [Aurantimonas sp. VKM B-3413]